MNVGQVNHILFRNRYMNKDAKNSVPLNMSKAQQIEHACLDYSVTIPQAYSKLGVSKLPNGIEVYSYKLANGYRVTVVPMKNSPAVVKNYVNVGSMNETADIKGISHFLEHMAFNGTNGSKGYKKLEVGDSFKKIDELGGWANASTNYAITDYVNSAPLLKDSDLETQIRIIAAMSEDLKLSDEMIEKEKGPVCSEINMILDDPQTIAMDQTVRTLYNIKNPADELVGGSVTHIKNLTRKDVKDYYDKYYTPDNMNLVVTGDVNPDEVMQIVSRSFHSKKINQGKKFEEKLSPIEKTIRKDFISDKTKSTSIIMGFAGPENNNINEKIAFTIAKEYLRSHSSDLEKNLKQYNSCPYIDIEKISTNPNANQLIYLGVNTADKNTENVLRGIYDAIQKLKPISETRMEEIKQGLKMSYENMMQYSDSVNNTIGQSVLNDSLEQFTNYEEILDNITIDDVNQALKKYFDLNKTAITVVHPEKPNTISFQGKSKKPIDIDLVSQYKLKNNYQIGFYETPTNNVKYEILLQTKIPYNKKPGVTKVLNQIYSMGYKDMNEEKLQEFSEKNNINIGVSSSSFSIYYSGLSNYDNRNLIIKKAEELIFNPAITQENLDKAKENIKDSILRHQTNAYDLYYDYETQNSPYEFSDDEILKSLDNITLEDVKDCHKYLIENSKGIVTANLPSTHKKELKKEVLNAASKYKPVKTFEENLLQRYSAETAPVVLTKANQNSQADIMQTYKFKYPENIREQVALCIMNSILSSSSIGLFDTLREKEHLAYYVGSSLSNIDDCGELSLNILTTTDNKNIGEFSYDNVEKSINGFHKQIKALRNGKFTDADLENAKLIIKADLLYNEGISAKLSSIRSGMKSKYGITYLNKNYDKIDKITREDIIHCANKVFSQPPIYSIAASQDTLDKNKEFLNSLQV